MNTKKVLPYIFLLAMAILLLFLKNCNKNKPTQPKPKTNTTNTNEVKEQRGLNRNPSQINYSKHAKCRMDCRHIDESEVKDMLATGTINYKKSDLQKDDCNKRYAIEGFSKDNQHLRIIAVPCANEVTIVTCIDIGAQWECHCEGDDH
jgi:Domain of unknown function (DUF4258)